MTIVYSTGHDGIDWAALKAALAADRFDNGRTARQMERSFRASFRCVYALDRHGSGRDRARAVRTAFATPTSSTCGPNRSTGGVASADG